VSDSRERQRCAAWARDEGVEPGGTAPTSEVFVLVEHPLPWPSDINDDPLLAKLEAVARRHAGDRSVRLQALVGDPGAEMRKVIVFAVPAGPFRGFGRLEADAAASDLEEVVARLVAAEPPPPADSFTDVLVCTHGSRDTCCGSFGTRLWLELAALGDDVRVWRTSHTGGHRFAPTAVTFPDGSYWARLDAGVVDGIIRRELPSKVAAEHLRGCAAFPPPAQVADRGVFAERGWGWFDCTRMAEVRSLTRVELCYETPDGERGSYDVCLMEGRTVPVPDCGADPSTAKKTQTELRVSRITAWT